MGLSSHALGFHIHAIANNTNAHTLATHIHIAHTLIEISAVTLHEGVSPSFTSLCIDTDMYIQLERARYNQGASEMMTHARVCVCMFVCKHIHTMNFHRI